MKEEKKEALKEEGNKKVREEITFESAKELDRRLEREAKKKEVKEYMFCVRKDAERVKATVKSALEEAGIDIIEWYEGEG